MSPAFGLLTSFVSTSLKPRAPKPPVGQTVALRVANLIQWVEHQVGTLDETARERHGQPLVRHLHAFADALALAQKKPVSRRAVKPEVYRAKAVAELDEVFVRLMTLADEDLIKAEAFEQGLKQVQWLQAMLAAEDGRLP